MAITQREAEVILKVNDQQTREKLDKLETKVKDLRQKFTEAFRKGDTRAINDISRQLIKTNKEIENLRLNAANIRAAMVKLNEASPRQLQQTIKMINAELNSGRVKRGSKEWDSYISQLKRVQRELNGVREEMKVTESLWGKITRKANDWGTAIMAGAATVTGLFMASRKSIDTYAQMAEEEANTRKFTGMTVQKVNELNEEFKNMDTRTARTKLNELAQEAGRLGKNTLESVQDYVEAANIINVALVDLGDGATQKIAKLTNIFGLEETLGLKDAMLSVGSAVNVLSQNCTASKPYLVEFTSRMSGVGVQAGITIQQMLGYGAVLDANNQKVESSSTALSQVLTRIYRDPAKYAKVAGLNVKEFTTLLKKDANEALIVFLETLGKAGNMDVLAPMFKDMGENGARAISALSTLSKHIEEVRWQQENANKAFAEATSATNEYNIFNNTDLAKIEKAKKVFTETAVTLGSRLMPAMTHCYSASSLMIKALNIVIGVLFDYKKQLIVAAATITAYRIAMAIANNTLKLHYAYLIACDKAKKAWIVTLGIAKGAVHTYRIAVIALTQGMNAATRATKLLHAAQASTQWGVIVAIVSAAAAAIASWALQTDDATEANKRLAGTLNKVETETRNEIKEIDTLFGKLDASTKGTKEYQEAKDKIINKYGKYLNGLDLEIQRLDDVAEAYRVITMEARNAAKARGLETATREAEDAYNDKRLEASKDISSTLEKVKLRTKSGNKTTERNLTDREIATIRERIISQAGEGHFTEEMTQLLRNLGVWKTQKGKFSGKSGASKDLASGLNKMFEAFSIREEEIKQAEIAFSNPQNTYAGIGYVKLQESLAKLNLKLQEYRETGSLDSEFTLPNGKVLKFQSVDDLNAEIKDLEQHIQNMIDKSEGATITVSTSEEITPNRQLSEKEIKEAERKKKEAVEKDLKALKAKFTLESTKNDAQYFSGEIDYQQHLEKKALLDENYLEERKQVYVQYSLEESAEYAELLKQEEDLKAKSIERLRKLKLSNIEDEHKASADDLTLQYYTLGAPIFQDKKALNQALLREDIDYLTKKRDLYLKKSPEWTQLNRQIDERVARDKLDKQKETAEALMAFQKEYGKASGSIREQMELSIINELHDKALISEEEYMTAVAKIKQKYIDEDIQKARAIKSEYADIAMNLYTSFSRLFSDLGQQCGDFWENLSTAGEAAFSFIGAMLQQYSAYSAAERDADIARIEQRYDKEIQAAGKNSKKTAELEKKKEAEIAKVKKAHNDKAMKIELAQAFASTALAAINAYASAAKVNWILGPIAAAMATAAGMIQIATIKKQHEAEAAGYYSGGFTRRDPDNRKEAGIVHANEFVANHQAVANPALSPILRLIDYAQRNNTVGSLSRADVSRVIGHKYIGESVRGDDSIITQPVAMADFISTNEETNRVLNRFANILEDGVEAYMIMDGERGFHSRYTNFKKLINNPKR